MRDDAGAVSGRVGVVGADHGLKLRHYDLGFGRVRSDNRERTDAFAVEVKALGVGGGDEEIHAAFGKTADGPRVFVKALAETLIGHIKEGNEALFLADRNHLIPFIVREIVARGVVAAGVKNHKGLYGQRLKVFHHRSKVDAVTRGVIVAVALYFVTGHRKNRIVVAPGGFTRGAHRKTAEVMHEVHADFQSPGAAQGLHRCGASGKNDFAGGAENHLLHEFTVTGETADRNIGMRNTGGNDRFFGFLHDFQNRGLAFFGEVGAHTEVHLFGARIGAELFRYTQNRVGGSGHKTGKKRSRHLNLTQVGIVGLRAAKPTEAFFAAFSCRLSLIQRAWFELRGIAYPRPEKL